MANYTDNEERLIRRGAALTDKTPLDGAASLEDWVGHYGISIEGGGGACVFLPPLSRGFQASDAV